MPDDVINPAGTEIANGPPANEQPKDDAAKDSVIEIGEDDLKNAGVDPQPEPEAGKEKPKAGADDRAAADGGAGGGAGGGSDERKPPKVKTRRSDARVAAATAEAARLREENDRMRSEMAQMRDRVVTTDHAALEHYERATKAELEAAKRDLVAAKKDNDPEKEVEAQERLSKAAAAQAQIDSFRAANPKPDPKVAPRQDQPRQEDRREPAAEPELPPEAQEWIANNGWFNPQNRDEFDEDMHVEARRFANLLEGKMMRQGKKSEIGRSEAYFKAIEDHVRAEFPDRFEDEQPPAERKQPQMSRPKAPVAGVGGGGAAPGAAPAGKTQVRLSADERKMAHSLADSGAITKPGGARMTHAEAERHFAIQKLKTGAKPAA